MEPLEHILNWFFNTHDRCFFVTGVAGTGKTTLSQKVRDALSERGIATINMAPTGKAAQVMCNYGIRATTIHRILYTTNKKSEKRLENLKDALDRAKDDKRIQELTTKINQEIDNLRRPSFKINYDSAVKQFPLVILDEAPMVSKDIVKDLLSFDNVRILAFGDPGQLPPVKGKAHFGVQHDPDIVLDKIYRQAEGNPIIDLSQIIYQGGRPQKGQYGESKVIHQSELDPDDIMAHHQLIVGSNDVRRKFNRRWRERLHGDSDTAPKPGDRVIVLKNNYDYNIMNGEIFEIQDVVGTANGGLDFDVVLQHPDGPIECRAFGDYFRGKEPAWYDSDLNVHLDYGYAITCHKSQGSAWESVYVWDESGLFRNNAHKWLYTAVTRAEKKVTLAVNY